MAISMQKQEQRKKIVAIVVPIISFIVIAFIAFVFSRAGTGKGVDTNDFINDTLDVFDFKGSTDSVKLPAWK